PTVATTVSARLSVTPELSPNRSGISPSRVVTSARLPSSHLGHQKDAQGVPAGSTHRPPSRPGLNKLGDVASRLFGPSLRGHPGVLPSSRRLNPAPRPLARRRRGNDSTGPRA